MDEPRLLIETDPVIEVYKKDVDRSLLRENLKLTVEERLRNLMRLQHFAEEMRRAGRQAFRG
jgi:adenylylsulfate kinase-like enzyme